MSRGPWYYRAARALALRLIPQPEPAVTWTGSYASWAEAAAAAEGYDSEAIFERVVAAARAVREGRAVWERDGVTFDEPSYDWPLVASLLHAASGTDSLTVVDIGGALGGTYHQHATLLSRIPAVRWTVVEQPAVAQAGAAEFTGGGLTFTDSLETANLAGADVALLGSSLGYFERPYDILSAVSAARVPFIIIDRTPFIADPSVTGDRLALQTARLTDGKPDSYPCWVFALSSIKAQLSPNYEAVAWWESEIQPASDPLHWGCLWTLKR